MSDEGKSSNSFILGAKMFLVLILTGIPCIIGVWMLTYATYVSSTIRGQAFLLSACCFFLGSLTIAFSGFSKEKAVLWVSGFIIAIGTLALSGLHYVVLLVLVYPFEALVISAICIVLTILFYLQFKPMNLPNVVTPTTSDAFSYSSIFFSNQTIIGGVELVQIPEDHLTSSEPQRYKPFLDLLRGLTLANIPLALRIERVKQKTRVFYLTWAKQESVLKEYIVRMEDNLQGNLSGMKFEPCSRFTGVSIDAQQTAVLSYLEGEPLSIEDNNQGQDTLTVIAKVLQTLPNGIIQISAIPAQFSDRKLKKLEEKYRSEIAQSERIISKPKSTLLSGEVQESTTRVDSKAQRKALSLAKQIERLSKKHLCEVNVATICWDSNEAVAEEHSKRLLSPLMGNLTPADKEQDFAMATLRNIRDVSKFFRGEPVGKPTLLSIDEATIYIIIPRCDLGIPVIDEATFHSNPATLAPTSSSQQQKEKNGRPTLTIGKTLDDSGRELDDFELIIDDLTSHSGFFGDTGSGKTMTQINILMGLYEKSINFLVLLASKYEDYVKLLRTVKGLRIFTIGDETTAPTRFCITSYHAGVHVNSIINGIKTIFVAAKPTEGMLKEYLEAVIELTFKRMGWDRDTNTRGLPIILQDFLETLPLLEKEFQYSTRGNEDFRGAIYGRLRSLCIGALSGVFGTISGMTIEELVSAPTIIRVDKLSKDERAFFLYWLITNITLHFEARKLTDEPTDIGLKHYTVLEEAHHFLTGGQGVKVDEQHGAQNIAIESISIGVSESRSSKIGFSIVTQKPSQLNNEICSMTMNMGMHRKGKLSERQLIGSQMNCNDEQIKMMGSLPVGQAVFQTASNSKPVRVLINNPFDLYPALANTKPITDEDIKTHMGPVYEESPHFKERQEFTKLIPELHELTIGFSMISIYMPSVLKLYDIINYLTTKGYKMGIEKSVESGSLAPVALIIKNLVKSVTDDSGFIPFLCHHLLWRFSSTDSSWTTEACNEVMATLGNVLSVDMLTLDKGLEETHERIQAEVMHHPKLSPPDDDVMKSIIDGALKDASDEYSIMPFEHPQKEKKPSTDESPLVETIGYIVREKKFSDSFRERMYLASKGDTAPLLRLIKVVTKEFVKSEDAAAAFSLTLLKRASNFHKTPIDTPLWNQLEVDITSKTP